MLAEPSLDRIPPISLYGAAVKEMLSFQALVTATSPQTTYLLHHGCENL